MKGKTMKKLISSSISQSSRIQRMCRWSICHEIEKRCKPIEMGSCNLDIQHRIEG